MAGAAREAEPPLPPPPPSPPQPPQRPPAAWRIASWISRRALLVALGALLVLAVAVAVIAYTQALRWQSAYSELRTQYDQLALQYSSLRGEYDRLTSLYASLQEGCAALSRRFNETLSKLLKEHNETLSALRGLKRDYEELKRRHESLQAECASLQDRYSSLRRLYSDLRASYDSLQQEYYRLQREHSSLRERYDSLLRALGSCSRSLSLDARYYTWCDVLVPHGYTGTLSVRVSASSPVDVYVFDSFDYFCWSTKYCSYGYEYYSRGTYVTGTVQLSRGSYIVVIYNPNDWSVDISLSVSTEYQELATTRKVVRVGALVPLTGGLASYGAGSRDAIALAVEDANKMCPGVRFEALFEDTGTDPTRALERLQALYARGARIVVGPMSSREVAAVKEFADRNKILIVSQSSTSPLLAIPGDWIYRVVPTDLAQARAIVDLLRRLNVTRAVILYRDDPWGAGLRDAVSREAAAAGVRIVAAEGYPPDPKEFPHAIPPALDKLARALGAPGTDAAVVFVSFEDDGIVAARSADASPVLAKVRWVGTDGWAYSAALAEQAGEVLARHRTLGTIARPNPVDPKYQEFAQKYKVRYGRDPSAYDAYAYDAAMMLMQIICTIGTDEPEKVKATLERWGREGRYHGITGIVYLDENGDRAFSDYLIWGVAIRGGKPIYVDAAYYHGVSRTIEVFAPEFFK